MLMFISSHDGILAPDWGTTQSRLVKFYPHMELPLLQPGRLPSMTPVYYIIEVKHLRSDRKGEHIKLM